MYADRQLLTDDELDLIGREVSLTFREFLARKQARGRRMANEGFEEIFDGVPLP